jgi:hypothetical protein
MGAAAHPLCVDCRDGRGRRPLKPPLTHSTPSPRGHEGCNETGRVLPCSAPMSMRSPAQPAAQLRIIPANPRMPSTQTAITSRERAAHWAPLAVRDEILETVEMQSSILGHGAQAIAGLAGDETTSSCMGRY